MDNRRAFALAFKQLRQAKGLTQEDFSTVSSRTYVSQLERSLKNPTLEKIQTLAETLQIHPLTLLTLTFMHLNEQESADELVVIVNKELKLVSNVKKTSGF